MAMTDPTSGSSVGSEDLGITNAHRILDLGWLAGELSQLVQLAHMPSL